MRTAGQAAASDESIPGLWITGLPRLRASAAVERG
jgi:hypothetical protein